MGMNPEQNLADIVGAFVERDFARQTEFLAELVKVPSDNPPGDCAAHAQRARALLDRLGLPVEAHEVPAAVVQAAGMKSATNLIVRHRFGDGPVIALNAHGDVVPPGLGWRGLERRSLPDRGRSRSPGAPARGNGHQHPQGWHHRHLLRRH